MTGHARLLPADAGRAWWRTTPSVAAAARVVGETADARVAFGALMAFTVVLVIAPQVLVPALAPLRLAFVAALLAVVGLLASAGGRARASAPGREVVIVLILLGWAALSVPLSAWPGGSLAAFDRYLKSVIVFWLIGVIVMTAPRLRALMWLLSGLTLPLALTGLYHFAAGVVARESGDRIVGYGQGLAANPNDLALTLALVLPLTLAIAATARSLSARVFALATALLSAAAIVVTFSRGGGLALLTVGVLCLFWLVGRGRRGLAAAIVGVALLVPVLLPSGYTARIATIANVNSDPTGSAQARWHDTVAATQFVAANPLFGAGIGMDILALNQVRGATWLSVHNAYLNYGVDLGLVGMGLFVLLLFTCIIQTRRVERRARGTAAGDELSLLAGGIRISLMAFTIAAFFYPVGYHFYFYYLAGLAVAVRAIADGPATATVHARELRAGRRP